MKSGANTILCPACCRMVPFAPGYNHDGTMSVAAHVPNPASVWKSYCWHWFRSAVLYMPSPQHVWDNDDLWDL